MKQTTTSYTSLFGPSIDSKIQQASILVVGAGGIGCEILKNLVLSGFKHIKVIDLDTIEMSNLNRQFLFRKEHIGQSKAVVAAKAASQFGDGVEIDAEHANIMNSKFDLFFFQSFDIVFNALDNVKARQYVNTMCVLANVPLIEGGSTGLLGQSYPIIPHYTECYNCRPRGGDEGEKYAICTIRSTPDKLEHSIVWGKEFFSLLFGETTSSLLYEEVDSVYMDYIKPTTEQVSNKQTCLQFCIHLLEAMFDKEIEKRLLIGSYSTIELKPITIDIRKWIDEEGIMNNTYLKESENYEEIWNVKKSVNILLTWLMKYYLDDKHSSIHIFDKDNHGDIAIVTAATNLRCYSFHIQQGSLLAIKKIAGNIIPAVASTNAIVAGLQVLSAVKILSMKDQPASEIASQMRYSYLLKVKNNKNHLLQSVTLLPPAETCLTCNCQTHLLIVMDTKKAHFRGFLEEIVKDVLHFQAPLISIGTNLLYEEPAEDEEPTQDYSQLFATNLCNLPDGGIQHGSIVYIEDLESNQHCSLTIYHQPLDMILEKYENGYFVLNPDVIQNILNTKDEEVKNEEEQEDSSDDSSDDIMTEDDDEDDCCIVDSPNLSLKRDHIDNENEQASKKQKMNSYVCY